MWPQPSSWTKAESLGWTTPELVSLSPGLDLSQALGPVSSLGVATACQIPLNCCKNRMRSFCFSLSRNQTFCLTTPAVGISTETSWRLSLTSSWTHGRHFRSTAACGMLGGKVKLQNWKAYQVWAIKIGQKNSFSRWLSNRLFKKKKEKEKWKKIRTHFGWDIFQTSALYCTMQLENYSSLWPFSTQTTLKWNISPTPFILSLIISQYAIWSWGNVIYILGLHHHIIMFVFLVKRSARIPYPAQSYPHAFCPESCLSIMYCPWQQITLNRTFLKLCI